MIVAGAGTAIVYAIKQSIFLEGREKWENLSYFVFQSTFRS